MDGPNPALADVSYLVGLDLAQGGLDYTALCVLERVVPANAYDAEYTCLQLHRWRNRDTTIIPGLVTQAWRQILHMTQRRTYERTGVLPEAMDVDIRLVVDQTGVTGFGLDPLRQVGFDPVGIFIHGGASVSHPRINTYHVPKRDLAGVVSLLLQQKRFKINPRLPDAAVLRAELENFRVKISKAGHDSYGAGEGADWREGEHDDLVLAVAMAAWLGEKHPTPRLDPRIVDGWTDLPGYR